MNFSNKEQLAWQEKCAAIQSATKNRVRESAKEREQTKKRMLNNIHLFKHTIFPHYFPLEDAPYHIALNDELVSHKEIMQFRCVYRSGGKSVDSNLLCSTYLMLIGENPLTAIVSINQDKASVLLGDIQAELENNEIFKIYFGEQKVQGYWEDGEFLTKAGTLFKSFGAGQAIHGLRNGPHRLSLGIADDFDAEEFGKNKKRAKEAAYEIGTNMRAAMEGSEWKRTIINQNYKIKGGILSELLKDYGKLPASKVHIINICDEDGEPTWKARYPDKAAIKKKEKEWTPTAWKREFLNQPVIEGSIIKEEWLRYVKVKPLNEFPAIFRRWDLSYKVGGDYKSYAELVDDGTYFYLIDIDLKKIDMNYVADHHYKKRKEHRGKGRNLYDYYDATAAQKEVFLPYFKRAAQKYKDFVLPTDDYAPSTDKLVRMEATLAPLLMSGFLLFSEELLKNPDWEMAKHQLLSIQAGSKEHDDFPDNLEALVRLAEQKRALFCIDEDYEPSFDTFKKKSF